LPVDDGVYGPDARLGSWLCKNAKTLNRDRGLTYNNDIRANAQPTFLFTYFSALPAWPLGPFDLLRQPPPTEAIAVRKNMGRLRELRLAKETDRKPLTPR
jgi:hypothetical protein